MVTMGVGTVRRYQTQFERLKIGSKFRLGGTSWVKQSTRTARTVESPGRVFYFGKKDICVITDLALIDDELDRLLTEFENEANR